MMRNILMFVVVYCLVAYQLSPSPFLDQQRSYFKSEYDIVHKEPRNTLATFNNNQSPTVSYQIVSKNHAFDVCKPGIYRNKYGERPQVRGPLYPTIHALTNFSATLSLQNIRILVMGDSVAMQLFEVLDFVTGGSAENRTVLEAVNGQFSQFTYALSSAGKVGAWRMTHIFRRENEGKPIPNAPGGGWNATMARAMLDLPDPNTGLPIPSFDVIVYEIPLGWMRLRSLNVADIYESLQLANQVFGVKKAILLTMPFMNNIRYHNLPWLLEKNLEIQSLETNFKPNHSIPGIEDLIVMDFAELGFQFIQAQAALLGYLNDTDSPNMTYLSVRVEDYKINLQPAAAHVCSGPFYNATVGQRVLQLCEKNAISVDGMHLCLETWEGRLAAGFGCLLQCLYPPFGHGIASPKECNNRYMTLNPVAIP